MVIPFFEDGWRTAETTNAAQECDLTTEIHEQATCLRSLCLRKIHYPSLDNYSFGMKKGLPNEKY